MSNMKKHTSTRNRGSFVPHKFFKNGVMTAKENKVHPFDDNDYRGEVDVGSEEIKSGPSFSNLVIMGQKKIKDNMTVADIQSSI